jgi:hypothetical protein
MKAIPKNDQAKDFSAAIDSPVTAASPTQRLSSQAQEKGANLTMRNAHYLREALGRPKRSKSKRKAKYGE